MKLALQHAVGSLLLLSLLGGCSSGCDAAVARCDPNLPQPGTWRDPPYPHAQQIAAEPDGSFQKTIFNTPDSPEVVLVYYQQALLKAGWGVEVPQTPTPQEMHFTAANCCAYGWVIITTARQTSGHTLVTVQHGWNMGGG